MSRRLLPLIAPLAVILHSHLAAQDVEMLAREYGTTVPAAYYAELQRNPDAYRFGRGWRSEARVDALGLRRTGNFRGAATLGRREGGVSGTFTFPLILGLYSDSPGIPMASPAAQLPDVSLTRDVIQREFFDGPNSILNTIPEFYTEVSGGRVTLVGDSHDWFQTGLTGAEVTGNSDGLSSTDLVGEFIIEILRGIDDGTVDWGQYDSDGPDGLPNSGDDDGFVDVLTVMHPTAGAECSVSEVGRVWSHRWQLSESTASSVDPVLRAYVTQTPSANGGQILIDDYAIVAALGCDARHVNQIGIFAHELGHGFGLPDLYAVGKGKSYAGVGRWGLMGSGAWGCTGGIPARPCHMTAWSKEALGWANVTTLAPDADLGVITLDPVETSGDVIRIDAGDGSGDYFLLENRQPLGFDVNLFSPGLLVWQIDVDMVGSAWPSNIVNSSPGRMGVWLRQGDGENDLALGNQRGDDGDPFPGSSGQTQFTAGSLPAAFTYDGLNGEDGVPRGRAAGVTLLDIQQVGEQMQFRALTRYQTVTLQATGSLGPVPFLVDGVETSGNPATVVSAPFQKHTLEAAGGDEPVDGFRNGFIEWEDGAPRIREWTTELTDAALTATYGNPEVRFDVSLESPVPGVEAGRIVINPPSEPGWVLLGTEVSIAVETNTGFAFRGWTGFLAGQPNPTTITLTEPASAGAEFDVSFGLAGAQQLNFQFDAAIPQSLTISVENGNEPIVWEQFGELPFGLHSHRNRGEIHGTPLEMGDFNVTLGAADAIGLTASAALSISVGPPTLGLQTMANQFLRSDPMDPNVAAFLDYHGNQDDEYDLGDFRAWILANPGHPVTQMMRAADPIVVPLFLRKEESR